LVVAPVTEDGAVGTAVIAYTTRLNAVLVPHEPTARTLKLAVLYVELKLNVMLFVVELPVAPVGNVHK
jgi:tetrahydromethanopterin S-methyltransferase subunit C